MSANEKTADAQKKKHRSPGYPVIPIDEAIDRLRQIYRQDKRAFTTFEAILQHMGYAAKKRSGTSGRVVAALRQYGLLDERAGQFRVSDLGFRILEMPEDSEERTRLVSEAALTPTIFRKILSYYEGQLPSDAALRSHLIFQEKFNPDSVEHFIRVFRRIIEIANPSPDDYNAGEDFGGDEQPLTGGAPMQQSTPPFTGHPGREVQRQFSSGRPGGQPEFPPPSAGDLHFPLYLSKDKKAAIYVPAVMTKKEYELLKRQIENSLAVMEATSVVEEEASPAASPDEG